MHDEIDGDGSGEITIGEVEAGEVKRRQVEIAQANGVASRAEADFDLGDGVEGQSEDLGVWSYDAAFLDSYLFVVSDQVVGVGGRRAAWEAGMSAYVRGDDFDDLSSVLLGLYWFQLLSGGAVVREAVEDEEAGGGGFFVGGVEEGDGVGDGGFVFAVAGGIEFLADGAGLGFEVFEGWLGRLVGEVDAGEDGAGAEDLEDGSAGFVFAFEAGVEVVVVGEFGDVPFWEAVDCESGNGQECGDEFVVCLAVRQDRDRGVEQELAGVLGGVCPGEVRDAGRP